MKSKIVSGALSLLLVVASRDAFAAQDCLNLKKLLAGGAVGTEAAPPPVFVTGSSALKPVLAALGPITFGAATRPSTIVYLSQGSCKGIEAKALGTPMVVNNTTINAVYWDPNSVTVAGTLTAKEETCTFTNPTSDVVADIGASDVFPQTCLPALQGLPMGVADFQGPIQSMTMAVNKNSKENSISAEAAYLVFGIGTLAPWTDPTAIYRRNSGSGTQQMIGTAIGVDATKWLGVDRSNSGNVFTSLSTFVDQATADKSIGILAADFSSKPEVKQLAYQHYGQRCGYKPDATPSGLDKRNTREGRYAIWGPIHLLTQVDASGFAFKQEARDLIAYLTGTEPPPLGVDLIRTEVGLHVVPPCAMKVQRKTEIGPMTPFTPTRSCGCKWDKEATGSTTCAVCTTNAQCKATESCNFGFCEKQ